MYYHITIVSFFFFFFFNDTATTEIYTLSLHDALPISSHASLIVHWNKLDVFGSESEHRNRLVDCCVRIAAGGDTNFRRAVKTLASNVPPASTQQFVATGTQA